MVYPTWDHETTQHFFFRVQEQFFNQNAWQSISDQILNAFLGSGLLARRLFSFKGGLICAQSMPTDELLFLGDLAESAGVRKASLVTRGNPQSISERGGKNAFTMPTWKVKEISVKDI